MAGVTGFGEPPPPPQPEKPMAAVSVSRISDRHRAFLRCLRMGNGRSRSNPANAEPVATACHCPVACVVWVVMVTVKFAALLPASTTLDGAEEQAAFAGRPVQL